MEDRDEVKTVEGEIITDGEEEQDEGVLAMLERLTVTTQVDAVKQGRKFFTVDRNLNPILAGYVQNLDFDDGRAKGLIFIDKGDGKEYSLGNPGRRQIDFPIVNHHQVLRPIADAGFDIATVTHNRGGAGVFALFKHPTIKIPDTMSWDAEQYSERTVSGDLNLSIAAWVDARLGKSIRLAVGFFREVCTNGLVSSIIGLGHLRITHRQFALPKIDQFAIDAVKSSEDLALETFSPKVLDFPIKMLDQYQRQPDSVMGNTPSFVTKPFMSSLGGLPAWGQDEALYQMNLAKESAQPLSTLDVMNMLTNVNHAGENNSLLFRMETISEAFVQLLEVAAFKQGIEFPSIITNANVR